MFYNYATLSFLDCRHLNCETGEIVDIWTVRPDRL